MNVGRQSGVALVTVLLVALVITAVALALSQKAQLQVQRAAQLDAHAQAEMAAHSAMNDVVLALLTHPMGPTGLRGAELPGSDGPEQWNIYGVPFLLREGVEVTLQDMAGQVGMLEPQPALWESWLTTLGLGSTRSERVVDSLRDWSDSDSLRRLNGAEARFYRARGRPEPRNYYLQAVDELHLINGIDGDRALVDALRPNLALAQAGHFNPATASPQLLAALMSPAQVDALMSVRSSGNAEQVDLWNASGVRESDSVIFWPAPQLRIRVRAVVDSASATREAIFDLRERADQPYSIWMWQ